MLVRKRRARQRGGVLLDLVLALAFVLVGAFVLAHVGISFSEIVTGARRFFAA
jgi:hydrogenase maturation factor